MSRRRGPYNRYLALNSELEIPRTSLKRRKLLAFEQPLQAIEEVIMEQEQVSVNI